MRSWRRKSEIFEISFWDVGFVFTRPFNSNTRNRRDTFERVCKPWFLFGEIVALPITILAVAKLAVSNKIDWVLGLISAAFDE